MKEGYKRPILMQQSDKFESTYTVFADSGFPGCKLCPYGVDIKDASNVNCQKCMTIIFGSGKSQYEYCEQ